MGLTTPANNFIWGIAKQTNEATVNTIEEYGLPVYSGRSMPVQTTARVEITDNTAMAADPYKNGDEHWEADVVVPAFGAPLGRLLTGLWPTDTITGSGPFTHTFSGLGGPTNTWYTTFNTDLLGGAVEETFEAGIQSEFSISGDGTGGPAKVGVKYVGKRPTIAAYTNATVQALSSGYFTFSGGTLKYEVDAGTPVTETNIQSFTLTVPRPVTPVATADSVSVNFLALGKIEPTFSMTLLMANHEAYRATFFGAVAGSTPSSTLVSGSAEINLVHTVTGTHSAKFTIDRAILMAEPPQPDPSAAPLTVTINGVIQKPASGDHVKPVVVNAVAVAY